AGAFLVAQRPRIPRESLQHEKMKSSFQSQRVYIPVALRPEESPTPPMVNSRVRSGKMSGREP
ncbi:MAG TPA: hypothetical protein VMW42_11065, partial [Desulfatiglandales bacterium]|nr:hypothetical protein [Desulfatiglandales bacterium]